MEKTIPNAVKYDKIFNRIKDQWVEWAINTNTKKFIIGISGGKDSTCCAALAVKIFGKENVIGVSMPNGKQLDMFDVDKVFKILGIERVDINIEGAFLSLTKQMENLSEQAKVNLPARLRMATLFMVAQTYGGKVICTHNKSERYIGYSTLFGDDCGSYAPIADLTCSEVMSLAEHLGISLELAFKEPSDGLCGKTDEENLGFTYKELDKYLKENTWDNYQSYRKIQELNRKNAFKSQIVYIPYPDIEELPF